MLIETNEIVIDSEFIVAVQLENDTAIIATRLNTFNVSRGTGLAITDKWSVEMKNRDEKARLYEESCLSRLKPKRQTASRKGAKK